MRRSKESLVRMVNLWRCGRIHVVSFVIGCTKWQRCFAGKWGYDFVQWGETGDDGHGYLVVDIQGRALGGVVVRWCLYKDCPPGWFLDWVWIAPTYRRQGLLKKLWETCDRQYPGILPRPPFSLAAAMFIQGIESLPARGRDYARHTVISIKNGKPP
jgi:hypothetical protein